MDRFREASMSEKTDEGTVSTPSVDTPSSSTPSTTTGTTTTAAMTTTATTATARTATTTTTGRKRDGIRKGTRTMTPEQLERKRANDREAQRTIRQRTKEHIENLENQVAELRAKSEQMNRVMQRNAVLEAEIAHLRQQLAVLNSKRAIYSSVSYDPEESLSQVSSTEATSSVPSPFGSPQEQVLGSLPGQIPTVAAIHGTWPTASQYAPLPDAATGEMSPYIMLGQIPSNAPGAHSHPQPPAPPPLSPQYPRPQNASPPGMAGQDLSGLGFQFPHQPRFAPASPSAFPAQLTEQSMVAGHHQQGLVPMGLSTMGYDASAVHTATPMPIASPTTSPGQQQSLQQLVQQQKPPTTAPQTAEVYQEHGPTTIPSSGANNPYMYPP